MQYPFPTRNFHAAIDKAFTEGNFSATGWKAREMGLAELKLYQDDERNVLRPFLELLVCLHQLADFQGKLWTVVLLEQVKVEPFATA